MAERIGIYFAPRRNSALARFGDRWLGRDVETDITLEQPKLAAISAARLQAITEAPRHYGFHGTLKPPFALATGSDRAQVQAAVSAFAADRNAFHIARLKLKAIGNFLALSPADPVPALDTLAADCVRAFDPFRAPPDAAELAKRLSAGLTTRQSEHLARWGYPYVFDEFRFHLTLTGAITNDTEREIVQESLSPLLEPLLSEPVLVDALCLFHQPDRRAPFKLIARHSFCA